MILIPVTFIYIQPQPQDAHTAENDIQLTDSRETETSVLQPPGNHYFCPEWVWKQTFLQNLQIWAQAIHTLIWVLWDLEQRTQLSPQGLLTSQTIR